MVNPRDVDLEDETYLIPSFSNEGELRHSIAAVGILNSPVLQERNDVALIPVLGRRRLLAARTLGIEAVEARIVPRELPVTEGFRLAFWDNLPHRFHDRATVSVVVRRLLELFSRATVAAEFLPPLGIPPQGPKLERLRTVGGLEPEVLSLLSAGRIHEKSAMVLARLDPADRTLLLKVAEGLGLNANRVHEVFSGLVDVALFHRVSIAELVERSETQAILGDWERPPQARAEAFRRLVLSWRNPDLVEKQGEFRQWVGSLHAPDHVTVRPTLSFENPECVIEIRTKTREEAEGVLDKLSPR